MIRVQKGVKVPRQLLCRALSHGGGALEVEDHEGYIHRSIVPTKHYQNSLPRLPIPPLESSCAKYLSALKPLLSADQYKDTEQLVNDFIDGEGKNLQTQLMKQDSENKEFSYIHKPWTELYQKNRDSIVLNSNPFLGFIDDPVPANNTQLNRATNLILSSLRFFRTYRDEYLEPDMYHMQPDKTDTVGFNRAVRLIPNSLSWYGAYMMKAFPLCMRQYPMLFQSTRIPKLGQDENRSYPDSKHLVVIHKGHFYSFDALDNQGNMLSGDFIKANLNAILNDPRSTNKYSLGYFTALERDRWAELRSELNELNPDLMLKIDSAMFVVCLDDYEIGSYTGGGGADVDVAQAIPLIKNGLQGEGFNRWFDKSFNMIVTQNGKAAIHFEHSWGDGVSVLRYFNEIFKDSIKRPHKDGKFSVVPFVEKLDPVVTANIISNARSARDEFNQRKEGFVLDVMKFEGFGRKDLKKLNVSPDAICQLAFQMAQWRLHGKFVGSYESCSTAAFRYGRTETVRPCTIETEACSKAFDKDHSAGIEEMSELLRACSSKHNKICKEAAMGQGFDRHLFALKHLNEGLGNAPLPMFSDPSYTLLNHITLSTSTLSSTALEVGGFAAVVQDGLGLGYAMFDDWFGCQASYYPPHNDGSAFVKELHGVCDDLLSVLSERDFKQKRAV